MHLLLRSVYLWHKKLIATSNQVSEIASFSLLFTSFSGGAWWKHPRTTWASGAPWCNNGKCVKLVCQFYHYFSFSLSVWNWHQIIRVWCFFFNLGDEYWRRIISSDFCTKRRQGEQNFSVVTDEWIGLLISGVGFKKLIEWGILKKWGWLEKNLWTTDWKKKNTWLGILADSGSHC